ncbi:MAG: aconitase X catalytic domain-containing protein [Candidatus Heimdallarchaeaceae archaeon]
MYLTREQEQMLEGEQGEAISKLMKLIVKIGDINNAQHLIPIKSAQIAGVSYFTVGDAIFSFFEMLSKDKVTVKVPTWLNPAGMDLEKSQEMGIDNNFAQKQFQIIDHYKNMGIKTSLTCTPYLVGNAPHFGDHLAWSESSAVVMANGYFGARTNREGGPSSLASAITGLTAEYGLHLQENRQPDITIKVEASMTSLSDFSALGYWFGDKFRGKKPYYIGLSHFSIEEAKILSAAMAASGSVAIYHVKDITPESTQHKLKDIQEHVFFTNENKKEVYNRYNYIKDNIDLVAIGCPHVSEKELELIYHRLLNTQIKEGVEFWVFTSRKILNSIRIRKIVELLEKKGVKTYADTCMVVSPVIRKKFKNIATNSAKAVFYLAKSANNNILFDSVENILERVTK